MKQMTVMSAVLILSAHASTAVAADYDYEIGLSYGNSDTDAVSSLGSIGPNPAPEAGTATSASDSDRFEIAGTWYYSGLSDTNGPWSRAAFLSRASGVSVAYAYTDESSSFSTTGSTAPFPISPPSSGSGESTADTFNASLRHVWPDSGWYAIAGVSRIETEVDTVFQNMNFSFDVDATAYTAGFGRYLGKATAIDVSVISTDVEGDDATAFALSFSHIGALGNGWQYGADIGIAASDQDGDDGSYSLGLSLFPTNEFEFGIAIVHRESGFDLDQDLYEGFASWFVRQHIELRARYGQDDIDAFGQQDYNSDQFGLGINVRF